MRTKFTLLTRIFTLKSAKRILKFFFDSFKYRAIIGGSFAPIAQLDQSARLRIWRSRVRILLGALLCFSFGYMRRWGSIAVVSVVIFGILLVNFSAVYVHRSSVMAGFDHIQNFAKKNDADLTMENFSVTGFLGWKPSFMLKNVKLTNYDSTSEKIIVGFGDVKVVANIFSKELELVHDDISISISPLSDATKSKKIYVTFLGEKPRFSYYLKNSVDSFLRSELDKYNEWGFSYDNMLRAVYKNHGFEIKTELVDGSPSTWLTSNGANVEHRIEDSTDGFAKYTEIQFDNMKYHLSDTDNAYPKVFRELGSINFMMNFHTMTHKNDDVNPKNDGVNNESNASNVTEKSEEKVLEVSNTTRDPDIIEVNPFRFESDLFGITSISSISRISRDSPTSFSSEIKIEKKYNAARFVIDVLAYYLTPDITYSPDQTSGMIEWLVAFVEKLPDSKSEGDDVTIFVSIDHSSGKLRISGVEIEKLVGITKSDLPIYQILNRLAVLFAVTTMYNKG